MVAGHHSIPQAFCEREGLSFIETSALEATNVEQVRRAAGLLLTAGTATCQQRRQRQQQHQWRQGQVCMRCWILAWQARLGALLDAMVAQALAHCLSGLPPCHPTSHPQAFQRILTEIYHIVSKKALASEDGPAAVRGCRQDGVEAAGLQGA